MIPALQFIHTQVYRYCFGKAADGLEKSVEGDDECELVVSAKTPCLWRQKTSEKLIVIFDMVYTRRQPTDMLTLNNPPLTQHISIPKDLSQLSCEAFSAGIVEGVLEGLDMVSLDLSAFASPPPRIHWGLPVRHELIPILPRRAWQPARVTAHTVPTDQFPRRTVVLIKLDRSVLDREEGLGK